VRANPPWANRALKQSWPTIESAGLPLPVMSGKWKFEELGCGHYGCVIPTTDESIVFKLTSDPTEAEFIQLAAPLGWPDGIVTYYKIIELDFTYRKRTVFAIWRQAAFNVGELLRGIGYRRRSDMDYEDRARHEFADHLVAFSVHAGTYRDILKRSKNAQKLFNESQRYIQWAWDNFSTDEAKGEIGGPLGVRHWPAFSHYRGAYKLAALWRACEVMAELMEHTYLSDNVGGALGFYMENKFLLADVHLGNIGQVKHEDYDGMYWAITDPGHVVVL
jgi:hypothetical protein